MSEKLPEAALDFFRKHGARGGKIGSKKRNEKMTPEERSASAKHAVDAREAKRKAAKKKTKAGV